MPDLLASSFKLNNIKDLPRLIAAPWYADVAVYNTKVGETNLSSCTEYFDNAQENTRTVKDNEMSAYLEFKTMCEATRLLINASDSKESFLPADFLNQDLPNLLPKKLAFHISTEESKKSAQSKTLKTWNDVTPITRHESQSATKSTYFHQGGYQEVEILGNGDINNDNIEDVIIVVRDYAEGGNYFNMRLFILSINSHKSWKLISDFTEQ